MPNILVVTGSVRPNSVNSKVVPLVVNELKAQGANVSVADLQALNLPFYDSPWSSTAPEFEPTHESVKEWTRMVVHADGVVLVTPEYNHMPSPVQANAVDWIGKEWAGKKIAFVGYGWTSGAHQSQSVLREALESVLKAEVGTHQTNLFFMKDLSPDGTVINEDAVSAKISTTIGELLAHA